MEVFIGHRYTTFSWRRWINYQPENKNTFNNKYEMPKKPSENWYRAKINILLFYRTNKYCMRFSNFFIIIKIW